MIPPPPRSTLFPYTTLFRSLNLDARVLTFTMVLALATGIVFGLVPALRASRPEDRKSTRLNSSHRCISYAVFCLKKKKTEKASSHSRLGERHISLHALLYTP